MKFKGLKHSDTQYSIDMSSDEDDERLETLLRNNPNIIGTVIEQTFSPVNIYATGLDHTFYDGFSVIKHRGIFVEHLPSTLTSGDIMEPTPSEETREKTKIIRPIKFTDPDGDILKVYVSDEHNIISINGIDVSVTRQDLRDLAEAFIDFAENCNE